MKKNIKVRIALKQYHLKQWQLANLLNVSEGTLCKKFRKELPMDEQEEMIQIIRKEGEK